MTYQQTLDYLYEQLPMFHRIGAAAYKANLDNTLALCKFLKHPENKFQSVHIAGTNGKGSTSHMLAAILQTAGYNTGLYTSPHLKDFRERIRLNGKMISENEVILFVERYKNGFEKIQPSFFEWTVALAFDFFAREKVEIAVIETGLGGRLDSTNVITPLLSVITNISWDHANLLGDTLEKIAGEKAGIIKNNIPVVIGEKQIESAEVFIRKAVEQKSELVFASEELTAEEIKSSDRNLLALDIYYQEKILFKNLQLDLTGIYQKKNILTLIQTVIKLRELGLKISDENIYSALSKVKSLTGLSGRWQNINTTPLTICDVAHNKDGIIQVLEQIKLTPHHHLHFVLGMVNDKDISSILSLLPKDATYYFCKANIPRAIDAEELLSQSILFGLNGKDFSSVKDALQAAQAAAQNDDLIFVGGSTFVVAEVI